MLETISIQLLLEPSSCNLLNMKSNATAKQTQNIYSFALGALIMVSATILRWILPVAVLGMISVK